MFQHAVKGPKLPLLFFTHDEVPYSLAATGPYDSLHSCRRLLVGIKVDIDGKNGDIDLYLAGSLCPGSLNQPLEL